MHFFAAFHGTPLPGRYLQEKYKGRLINYSIDFSALLIHGFVKPARACLTAVQVQLSIGHKNVIGLRERLGMRSQAQRYLWLSLLVVQTLDIHLGSQVTAGRSDHVVC